MFRRLVLSLALLTGTAGLASAGEPDKEGCKDPPLVSRMKGFHIYSCETKEFDSVVFWGDNKATEVTVEGRHTALSYNRDEGAQKASALQITRNYENALKAIGGTVVSSLDDGGGHISTVRVKKDGAEYWVQVMSYNPDQYGLVVVQKKAMEQDVVADAAALQAGLAATGHVEVPGILFDTGKATLKPESDAALAEVAKLLKGSPALKVYVVGHTDNQGGLASNMALSAARADAVVKALTGKHGLAAARLAPFGAGPYAPVASNAAEPGRARNRRVELVAQ